MTLTLTCRADGPGFLVEAMLGQKSVTQAWDSCPYSAAVRVCGYLLVRLRGGKGRARK